MGAYLVGADAVYMVHRHVGFFRKDHESDPESLPNAHQDKRVQIQDLGIDGVKIDLVIIAVCVVLLVIFGTGGALGSWLWIVIAVGVMLACVQAWKLLHARGTNERGAKKG